MPDDVNRTAADRGHVTLSTNKARQGVELGTMRYVLAISTGVAIVALLLVYFFVFH
jgi:hypothetical protein